MSIFDSFDHQWQQVPSEDTMKNRQLSGSSKKFFIGCAVLIVLLILVSIAKSIWTEWLWFKSLEYDSVYITILTTKIYLFLAGATAFIAVFLGNVWLAIRITSNQAKGDLPGMIASKLKSITKLVVILVTISFAFIFGMMAQGNWELVLRFSNAQPFGTADPIFAKDISFYVFVLPFIQMLRSWILSALSMTLIATAAVYIISQGAQKLLSGSARPVLIHIGALITVIIGLFAWGYWLGIWDVVFSTRGVVFGAGYTDVNTQIPVQWVLMGIAAIVMVITMISFIRHRYRWAVYGISAWIVASIIIGGILPGLVQRFQVEPNELDLERKYLEYNIEFTRAAFGLNQIEEQSFPAEDIPSAGDIAKNPLTIDNIRLWDPRPLKDTYNQIQAIRLYYDFNDVDIDRYIIDNVYRQVMLSARELQVEKLDMQAQTWVNRTLQFTHGYGVAMSPVNEITAEGLPVLWMKDIPPSGLLDIQQPRIYFGEETNHYVIVKTKTPEFDYPMGEENVYGHWEGNGGVSLGNMFNKLLYAWEFGDINLLLSSELTAESTVLYHRNIQERVHRLAPFLRLDTDPYMVVHEGRLVWIQDAYTVTNRYPYSKPGTGGINYIRNSVKAVIDAYDGSVAFYVIEPSDPLIQTYQSIFPSLFKSAVELPESLRAHLRYPVDMFNIQSNVYCNYHMRDARVFYNKEDLWTVPREIYSGKDQLMEPYYTIMRLPDGDKEEFLLMLPFTPVNKNNAIGWLAARSDGDNYGKLRTYLFPKERLVYGPSQIENRIQQDTVITEQLALWSRGGSRVIRGNLLLIPLEKSMIYIEPVFLQSESGGLPELKRVIVSIGDRIVMTPTLKEGINAIFGASVSQDIASTPSIPSVTKPTEEIISTNIIELIDQAQLHYERAQEYLRTGDWSGYGKELTSLKNVLDRLAEYKNK